MHMTAFRVDLWLLAACLSAEVEDDRRNDLSPEGANASRVDSGVDSKRRNARRSPSPSVSRLSGALFTRDSQTKLRLKADLT